MLDAPTVGIMGGRKEVRNVGEPTKYETGSEPPEGVYACMKCDGNDPYSVMVPESVVKLPVCPKCGGTEWYKV